jgi:ferredoxin
MVGEGLGCGRSVDYDVRRTPPGLLPGRQEPTPEKESMMKVTVDEGICVGTGSCVSICPEVFEMGDSGIAVVKVDEVPSDQEDACREAMDACPVEAIKEA